MSKRHRTIVQKFTRRRRDVQGGRGDAQEGEDRSTETLLVGLVDPEWYAARYPDVPPPRAAEHFATAGHRERRDPCAFFDSAWYLLRYPDVAEAVAAGLTTPALHYVRWGASEARVPHPAVDVKWMLAEYPALHAEEVVPQLNMKIPGLYPHVILREAVTPRDAERPLFQVDIYRPPWPVPPVVGASAEIAAATDYILRGEREGLAPSRWFDPVWYRQQYPDVAAHATSLLGHFLVHGEAEGRLGVGPMNREEVVAKLRELTTAVAEASVMLASDPNSWPTPRKGQWTNVELVLADLLNEFANSGLASVVLVPYFGVGGAEKVANAASHYLGSEGRGDCLVLATEPRAVGGIPPEAAGVRAVWLDDFCGGLRPEDLTQCERVEVVTRLILALEPRVVVVVNSRAGWHAIRDAGRRLSSVSRLVGAYFCYDELEDGTRVGYAAETPPACLGWLHAVLLDNSSFVDVLAADQALGEDDRSKLHVVYQPVRLPGDSPEHGGLVPGSAGSRVLWASRICRQKNLLTLLRIAAAAPEIQFDVFGTGDYPDHCPENVHLMGPYDGFQSLPLEEYRAFIYTSLWDGLPNVLIEAAEARLPIVAGDIGGVAELVGPRTGYLVDSPEDVGGYLEALAAIAADPQEAARRAASAALLVQQRHSWESYETQMSKLLAVAGVEGFVRLAPPDDQESGVSVSPS